LNSTFKVLAQTVPDTAKNESVREMELYLGTMIRQVDSSLLDEWEKLRDPAFERVETAEVRPLGAEEAAADITRDVKAFTAQIRHRIFTFLRPLAMGDYEAAMACLATESAGASQTTNMLVGRVTPCAPGDVPAADGAHGVTRPTATILPDSSKSEELATPPQDADAQPWTAARLRAAMEIYLADHERLCLDPNARNLRHTYVTPAEDRETWQVQQMLVDPEQHNDWVAEFNVSLAASRARGEPVLHLRRFGILS